MLQYNASVELIYTLLTVLFLTYSKEFSTE